MNLHKKIISILLLSALLSSCAFQQLPDNLNKSFLNQSDVEVVKAGMPAYLIFIDAVVMTWPNDSGYLFTASKLYSSYAFFIDSKQAERAKNITDKSFAYAQKGMEYYDNTLYKLLNGKVSELEQNLDNYGPKYLSAIYSYATALTTWLLANTSDYSALMQMPKIELLFKWVIKQDETYENGMPYIYLGALNSILPPSVGGKPEVGKEFFEKAIKISKGKNLMARVFYAKTYAKLMYEKALFNKQLNLVLQADINTDGLILMNKLAQKEAKELLENNKHYFD